MGRNEAELKLEAAALEFARSTLAGKTGTKMAYARIQLFAEARNFAEAREEEDSE